MMALTSHGGHLGWSEVGDGMPMGAPRWVERATCSFLEAALDIH